MNISVLQPSARLGASGGLQEVSQHGWFTSRPHFKWADIENQSYRSTFKPKVLVGSHSDQLKSSMLCGDLDSQDLERIIASHARSPLIPAFQDRVFEK